MQQLTFFATCIALLLTFSIPTPPPKHQHHFSIDFETVKQVKVVWYEDEAGKIHWNAYWRDLDISTRLNFDERQEISNLIQKDIWK